MKIKEKLNDSFQLMRKNIRRFPLSLLFSTLYALLTIIKNEMDYSSEIYSSIGYMDRALFFGCLVFIALGLLAEREKYRESKKSLISLSFLVIIGYYMLLVKSPDYLEDKLFIASSLVAILGIFFMGKEGSEDYNLYFLEIIRSFLISFLYSGVVYLGLVLIVFTIQQLFGLDISPNIYFNIFIIIVCTLSNLLFISYLPSGEEDYSSRNISKVLEYLISYIMIPLLTVYTVILYIYFIKILVSREWPKGLISNLVLWYSILAIGVIFLSEKKRDLRLVEGFRRLLPKFIMPLLMMMFYAIYLRVKQYGFTDNRYYMLIAGLWVFAVFIYYNIEKKEKNIYLPISLIAVVIVASVGPVSSHRISIISQNRRLEKTLENGGMLVDGKIRRNEKADKEVQKELSSILEYFKYNYDLEEAKALGGDLQSLDDMEKVLGFKYIPYYDRWRLDSDEKYFGYENIMGYSFLDIKDYDYYISIEDSVYFDSYEQDGISVDMDKDFNILIKGEGLEERIELEELLTERMDLENPNSVSDEDLSFELGQEMDIIFRIKRMSGLVEDDRVQLNSIAFDIFFSFNGGI